MWFLLERLLKKTFKCEIFKCESHSMIKSILSLFSRFVDYLRRSPSYSQKVKRRISFSIDSYIMYEDGLSGEWLHLVLAVCPLMFVRENVRVLHLIGWYCICEYRCVGIIAWIFHNPNIIHFLHPFITYLWFSFMQYISKIQKK